MSRRPRRRRATLAGLTACAALALAPSALATFPGENGLIAFSRNGDIWTISPDGLGEKQLTFGAEHFDSAPEWTPDGGELFFQREGSDGRHIYRMKADGGGVTWVRRGETPQLSGDGTELAYLGQDAETSDPAAFVADRDGSNPKLVWPNELLQSVDDWAPTHSFLILTGSDGSSGFQARSPAGTQLLFKIADGRDFNHDGASYSPDGSDIVFSTSVSGIEGCDDTADATCGGDPAIGLRIMDIGSGDLHRIHSEGRDPVWSPDGERIAFEARDERLQIIDVDDGARRILVKGSQPDWQAVAPAPPAPPEPTVTVTVPVRVLGPERVVERVVTKLVTKVVTTDGKVCPIPASKRKLALTIRTTRAIKKGTTVKVWLDLESGRANVSVPKNRPLRVVAR